MPHHPQTAIEASTDWSFRNAHSLHRVTLWALQLSTLVTNLQQSSRSHCCLNVTGLYWTTRDREYGVPTSCCLDSTQLASNQAPLFHTPLGYCRLSLSWPDPATPRHASLSYLCCFIALTTSAWGSYALCLSAACSSMTPSDYCGLP